MSLDACDITLILDEVGHLVTKEIRPCVTPCERTMDASSFHQLMDSMGALGLFPCTEQDDTPGLWSDVDDAPAVQLSLGILRELARGNAALALAAHRRALAQWVLAACAAPPALAAPIQAAGLAMVAVGHHGLARESLGRWLAQQSLQDDDVHMLSDWLDRSAHATQVWATPGWQALLWPVWRDGVVQWRVDARHALQVQSGVAPHGLGELDTASVRHPPGAHVDRAGTDPRWCSTLDESTARQLMLNVLKMEFMATMAIGLGVLDGGAALARPFAALRRQGGCTIERHPAVQAMLCDISTTQQLVQSLLAQCHRPMADIALAEVAAARWNTSRALVHASHQVIQIHGGVGYMRDAGPEKLMRDQNMLRWTAGGAHNLPLLLSGLQGGQP
ncbi:MAG: acyl-CoA/acyl-ACP dehydrogenase [Burkholderiales bacterium]|nr:acyl-CoA/acyl-ACP dehydrogenase [Burkholderiales bacterium]